MAIAAALIFTATASADDGWTGFAGPGFTPTPRAEAAPAAVQDEAPVIPPTPIEPPKGEKGDRGDTGPQGETGPQGSPGVNADLCQNLPGIQTSPPLKYNAQRYWSFLPKWERRFLAVNRKGQLVCVTQRWINNHRRPWR